MILAGTLSVTGLAVYWWPETPTKTEDPKTSERIRRREHYTPSAEQKQQIAAALGTVFQDIAQRSQEEKAKELAFNEVAEYDIGSDSDGSPPEVEEKKSPDPAKIEAKNEEKLRRKQERRERRALKRQEAKQLKKMRQLDKLEELRETDPKAYQRKLERIEKRKALDEERRRPAGEL